MRESFLSNVGAYNALRRRMPMNSSTSSPSRRASPKLYAKAVVSDAISWFNASFSAAAEPTGPAWMGGGPKAPRKSFQRSNCRIVEPTMTVSSRARACGMLPRTGASA